MQTRFRAVMRPAVLVLAGAAIGAAVRPATGLASASPPRYRFVILSPSEIGSLRRTEERMETCATAIAMSTIHDAEGDKVAVLCRR